MSKARVTGGCNVAPADRKSFYPSGYVFRFDLENTLVDNDRMIDDRKRYRAIFEWLRIERGMQIIWKPVTGAAGSP